MLVPLDPKRYRASFYVEREMRTARGNDPIFEQHEGGANDRMPGEGHLLVGRENSDPRGAIGTRRGQNESGLREIQFFGDSLHLRFVQGRSIREHSKRVPFERLRSKDVDDSIAIWHRTPQ